MTFSTECLSPSTIRVAVIGNSITYHPAAGEWQNDWGMAATEPEKDYVHRLGQQMADGFCANVTISAMAAWRFEYGMTTVAEFAKEKEFSPDLLLLRLGDNPHDGPVDDLQDRICELVSYIDAPYTAITGTFYPTAADALLVQSPCRDVFIPLSDLWAVDENHAWAEQQGKYNVTILDHPGDLGMQRIANRIMTGISGMPLRKTFVPIAGKGEERDNTR